MIAARGADAVTVREVAIEAGVSTGVLSHYFVSRQQMLLHALQLSYRRAGERIQRCIDKNADPDKALREALRSILPMTDDQAREYRVWLCFWGHAVGDPDLDAANSAGYERTITSFELLIGLCQQAGTIRPDLQARREARARWSPLSTGWRCRRYWARAWRPPSRWRSSTRRYVACDPDQTGRSPVAVRVVPWSL